ncbi:MAG: hypothetical protein JSS36_12310 [Proteobacteria bacterium]|nr:hypothetical protein [Pseudomonadota bacterium]
MSDQPAPAALAALAGMEPTGFAVDPRYALAAPDPEPEAEPPEPEPDPLAEAWARGHAEGLAEGRAEAEAARIAADATRARFALAFERLDAELAEALRLKLRDTVVALCEAALAPLTVEPEALARRVSTAVALFQRADDERVIRLNPADLEVVAPLLPGDWTFRPDPGLEPGALRVETAQGGAEDGPAEWRRALLEALERC